MIEKKYRCDLCDKVTSDKDSDIFFRIRFAACNKIKLAKLYDNAASETVICKECLVGLQHYEQIVPS